MKKILFTLLFLFLFSPLAFGASIKIQWKANTEPDLAGYKVHYGTSHRTYDVMTDAGNTTTFEITNLDVGVYYVAVTAYDNATPPNESDYSYEVVKEIKMSPPEELEIIE